MSRQTNLRGSSDIWEHVDIRFDMNPKYLRPRRGEHLIDSIKSVEDTKGNNGERGSLLVTNLRLMWLSQKRSRGNLSIGLGAVQALNVRMAKSRLRGSTQALFVLCQRRSSRFEFIFTSLVKNSPRLFITVQAVLRAFESTKMYRELKLRGSVVRDGQLVLLREEEVVSKRDGVWNLSSDQGNLGTFFITNVRVVWHATLAQNFNVSVPYMQIQGLRVRGSKFGQALVIETSARGGGYVLGFRMDSQETLEEVFQEIQSLHRVYSVTPIFGVEYRVENAEDETAAAMPDLDEDVEILETEVAQSDALSAYFANGSKSEDRGIVFDPLLGLAIESIPGKTTTKDLWRIL